MPKDYLHTADDLMIADGDFVQGESNLQHQQLLLRLKKGELRQYPKTGVGVDDFLLDDAPGDVYLEIRKQFEADKLLIRKINLVMIEGKLETDIEAYYQ